MVVAEVNVSDGHGRVCSEQVQVHVRLLRIKVERQARGAGSTGNSNQAVVLVEGEKSNKFSRMVARFQSSHAENKAKVKGRAIAANKLVV